MARHDSDAALDLARLAVVAAPADGAPRLVLARALQSAGRFEEAVAAWDAVGSDPRARLSRALALLATGRTDAARAALHALPAGSDAGLALALAGDAGGLAMLEAAAAAPGATATVRQNLALAHALAGDWVAARALAVRDLPAGAVPERLSNWARLAAATPAARVGLMLGIAPKAPAMPAAPSPAPRLTSFAAAKAAGWAVQVGAYPSESEAAAAWQKLAALPPLAGAAPNISVRGSLLRVAVGGFADRLDAQRLCVRVKAAGADCFVRLSGRASAV